MTSQERRSSLVISQFDDKNSKYGRLLQMRPINRRVVLHQRRKIMIEFKVADSEDGSGRVGYKYAGQAVADN